MSLGLRSIVIGLGLVCAQCTRDKSEFDRERFRTCLAFYDAHRLQCSQTRVECLSVASSTSAASCVAASCLASDEFDVCVSDSEGHYFARCIDECYRTEERSYLGGLGEFIDCKVGCTSTSCLRACEAELTGFGNAAADTRLNCIALCGSFD